MNKNPHMRLILLAILICAVMLTIDTKQAEAYDIPKYIKVGLNFGSTAVSECQLSSDSGFILGTATQDGFTEVLPLPAYTRIKADVENGHIAIRDENGVLLSSDIGRNGCLLSGNYNNGGRITISSGEYRGGIMLLADSKDTITVINYLTMDEYLYGVLHREMSQDYPMEALKAQAVTSRSFAAANIGHHEAYGFDVCSTTDCQVYGGYIAERPRTNQAVDETRDEVILYQGEPVSVFYHKNSGGHTQSVKDVWYADLPYLIGVDDPYTPHYPWTATIHFDNMEQKLILAGYEPGTIRSVKVGDRSDIGSVTKLIIKGSKNEVTLENERIRSVLGTSLIRSRMFSLREVLNGSTDILVDMIISDGTKNMQGKEKTYVLSSNGNAQLLDTKDLYTYNGKSKQKVRQIETAATYDDSFVASDGKVSFYGKGYGHGVGMSQDGAIEMAKQGFSYREILHFYFTDIEVN